MVNPPDQPDGESLPFQPLGDEEAARPTLEGPAGRSLKILYTDDNLPLGDVWVQVLVKSGHQAEHASDGLAALEKVLSDVHHFDLVITANDTPVLSGIELVTLLRQTSFGGRIIVHSFALHERDLLKYRELKVDRIVLKGAGAHAMLNVVQELACA